METVLVRNAILKRPVTAPLGLLLILLSAGSAFALGTPEQRKACTPDVYRLCAGEIPSARAITACLKRHKASLSEGCRAVFQQ
jgi:hypothetical protein